MAAPTPTQSEVLAVLRTFLLNILPSGVPVVLAQVNRVPEVKAADFVLMTPLRQRRLATNFDDTADCAFTASVSDTIMTVSDVSLGVILEDATLLGANLTGPPVIVEQTSGPTGGVGTYVLSVTQGTVSSQQMATGVQNYTQSTEITVQLDVHGPKSADNAQVISTMFRDEYATTAFAVLNENVAPFYADDPKQIPFINDQDQYENRWVIEAVMQANQTVTFPQEFADVLTIDLINVEEAYPVS
jgi:hypothetical protein